MKQFCRLLSALLIGVSGYFATPLVVTAEVPSASLFSDAELSGGGTPPSVLVGQAFKVDTEQVRDTTDALGEILSPITEALNEDLFELVKTLSQHSELLDKATKKINFELLGKWGGRLEALGSVLDVINGATVLYDFFGAYQAGDEERFVQAVDDMMYSAALNVATQLGGELGGFLGEKGGAYIGTAIGTLICPGVGTVFGGVIGGFIGKVVGEKGGEALTESIFKPIYKRYVQEWIRDAARNFIRGKKGDDPPPEVVLPGVTDPPTGGNSNPPGSPTKRAPVKMDAFKVYRP